MSSAEPGQQSTAASTNGPAEQPRPTVLVAGATGYIGRHIVQAMHDAGYRVRALVRDRGKLEPVADACDEVFIGEVTRMETLDGACDGVDIVVSALGLRTLRARPTPEEVDLQANLNVLERAKSARVGQFIFVSVLHAEQLTRVVPILRPREQFVRQLESSGLAWTLLKPSGAFNDMKEIFRLAQRGWAFMLGNGNHRVNPVHPADIAEVAVRSITDTSLRNTEFGFGGPDIYTQRELAELASRILGKRLRTVRMPSWPLDAAATALRPFNRNASGFLRFFRHTLTRDMVGNAVGSHHLTDLYRELAQPGATRA